ncbi:MAG: hypothetical protein PVJ41_10595 [Desulfobacterales bacterium]|jgi:GNAT superfamily N-acetyltransferase
MGSIDIKKVENSQSPLCRDFIEMPFVLYRRDPNWVPWFDKDIIAFIDRHHPVFEHSTGEFFVALKGNQVVGRIFVFDNACYNQTHSINSAYFYFVDFIDDGQVVERLLQTAIDWAKARNLNSLMGPMGLGGVTGVGLLVAGFDQRAAMTMMMYNHAYYAQHFEEFGFTKFIDNFSFYLPTTATLPDIIAQSAADLLKKGECRVLEFKSKKQLLEIADDIVFVFAQTLSDHVGNYELSANELAFLKNSLVQIADHRLIKIITYKDKVIGFLFGFHDLSAAMQRAGGKLNLWSTFRLLREYKKADRILINGMGILPDFQGTGANTLLYAEIEKTIRQYTQFKHLEMVQIQETTAKMLSNVETLQGEIIKTHRVYQLKF